MTGSDDAVPMFWMLAGDRLHGPFTPDELIARKDFSARAPLCPDDALGGPDEEWRLAPAFPEFEEVFPRSSRESALRADAADSLVGSIESRMHLIDRNLETARRRLESRLSRFRRLRTDIRGGLKAAGEVAEKIQDVGSRTGHRSSIEIEIQRAKAALAMQDKRMGRLKSALKAAREEAEQAPGLRARISELEAAMDALKTAASDAPKHRESIARLEAELAQLKQDAAEAPRLKKRIEELEEELFRSSMAEDAKEAGRGGRRRRRSPRARRTRQRRRPSGRGDAGLPGSDFGDVPPL